jgi:hypothetical protein
MTPGTRRQYGRYPESSRPRTWTVPLVGIVVALFMMTGGIALAAQGKAAAPAAQDGGDCTLVVPANPLTGPGLATPYKLVGCKETDPNTSAFVQATIIDPATGAVSVYNPLVVDSGTRPAAAPTTPSLAPSAVVGIWFGFNGDNLTLKDSNGSLADGNCVNGLGKSIFGQFAFCNADTFFSTANAAIGAGKLSIPGIGTGADGQPCMTTRDFPLVDQDQSDNVTTSYLFLPDGTTAQNTHANQAQLSGDGATIGLNGSDNGLLDAFVDPTLRCSPMTAPDLADPGQSTTSLALNELSAAAHQAAPVALIPTNDPMVLVNDKASLQKTNLYRLGVDQPALSDAAAAATGPDYCKELATVGIPRIQADKNLTAKAKTPDAGAASNLYTFLGARFAGSWDELNCANLIKVPNPVKLTTNADGVVTAVTFAAVNIPPGGGGTTPTTAPTKPTVTPTTAAPTKPAPTTAAPTTAPTTPATVPTTAAAKTTAPAKPTTAAPAPTTAGPTAGSKATQTAPTTAGTTAAAGTGTGTGSGTGSGTGTVTGGGTVTGDGAVTPVVPQMNGISASPVPTLTLGPMKMQTIARANNGTTTATNLTSSGTMSKVAGVGMAGMGVLVTIAVVVYAVRNRRRERYGEYL